MRTTDALQDSQGVQELAQQSRDGVRHVRRRQDPAGGLLQERAWFHYSVDYRIGTRYMGEFIVDNFKAEAMKVPFLRDLLRSDSIYISSNITFANLEPLSTYLGRPAIPAGGLPLAEYQRRQEQHRDAEIGALQDVPDFIERAHDIYGYDHFISDTGGSLIEVVDPDNSDDPVIKASPTTRCCSTSAARRRCPSWSSASEAPKPMYYQPVSSTRNGRSSSADRQSATTPTSIPTASAPGVSRRCCTTACRATSDRAQFRLHRRDGGRSQSETRS